MDLGKITAVQLSKMIQSGEITAVEAAQVSLKEIRQKEKDLNAFITVDEEKVLNTAREVQKGIENGELTGSLAGVPVAVKDNICTKGIKTTCASKMLSDFTPPYDAWVVDRLKKSRAGSS